MVKRIAPVRSASAVGLTEASVRRTDHIPSEETGGLTVMATRLDLLETLQANVDTGRFLDAATEPYPTVVLGADGARLLGIDHLDFPFEVWVGDRWFTVIGILAPVPLAPEIDRSVLVSWPAAQRWLRFDGHPTTLYERSDDSAVADVRSVLRATVNPESPTEINVSRPSDALAAKAVTGRIYTGVLLGLGAIALLVGGIGVANTMVISVLERRREIGLRRALGANRRQIRGQFLGESVVLTGLGGVSGLLLGAGVTAVFGRIQGWPVVIPVQALAGGLALSVIIGALAGAYPAIRASRLTPTEALATV
jgi:putative ABC transport system permease protein